MSLRISRIGEFPYCVCCHGKWCHGILWPEDGCRTTAGLPTSFLVFPADDGITWRLFWSFGVWSGYIDREMTKQLGEFVIMWYG